MGHSSQTTQRIAAISKEKGKIPVLVPQHKQYADANVYGDKQAQRIYEAIPGVVGAAWTEVLAKSTETAVMATKKSGRRVLV